MHRWAMSLDGLTAAGAGAPTGTTPARAPGAVTAAAVVMPEPIGFTPLASAVLTSVGQLGAGADACCTAGGASGPGLAPALLAASAVAELPGTGGTFGRRLFSLAVWISARSFSGLSPKSQMLYG